MLQHFVSFGPERFFGYLLVIFYSVMRPLFDIWCRFANKSEDSEVRLVDFGSACELQMIPGHPGAFRFLKEKAGSLHVMAPEVVRGKYGPKADVWSLGCVAYMLLNNGEQPIKGQTK